MAQFARPDSDVTKGNWDDPNGNDNDILYDDIDEETPNDSDYIESPDNPSSEMCEVGLSNVTDPESSSNHTIRVRYQAPESGGGQPASIDFTIKLMEGATERASWTEQPDPPSTWNTASYTLTTGEADSISDYTNLRLQFIANQTGGARVSRIEISWAEFEVPAVGYILVCDTGSFTLTGQNIDLFANRIIQTLKGDFALTGQDAGLLYNRLLNAEKGDFTLTGYDVDFSRTYAVVAQKGDFVLTGQNIDLFMKRLMGVDKGDFTLSGQNIDLFANRLLSTEKGDFILTGQNINLFLNRVLNAEKGDFNLIGQDIDLLISRLLSAGTGSFILTGIDIELIYSGAGGYILNCNYGSFSLSGQDANLMISRILSGEFGQYTLTGQDIIIQKITLAQGILNIVYKNKFPLLKYTARKPELIISTKKPKMEYD